MEYFTISQVSKLYDVTPRMLRHYEKIGLIRSGRREDYAYRIYDEDAVRRLRQIVALRKLRIPLKDIAIILADESGQKALFALRENLAELDAQIISLQKVRSVLDAFVESLDGQIQKSARLDLLSDKELLEAIDVLSFPKSTLKKEDFSMEELNRANETLNRQMNVRILQLPPFTVASNHFIGENPEETVGDAVSDFVQKSSLYEMKPDSRMFGFNHPNPGIRGDGLYGYEVWVTIPDDMDVPAPLVKKTFDGGLYAAYTIKFGDFHLWKDFAEWVENSEVYEPDYSCLGEEIMGGCLEEHLNWVYGAHNQWCEGRPDGQIDLLMPIKRRIN